MTASLPDPVGGRSPYTIVMLCLGNICRSPTAQVVLTERLDAAGLGEAVQVISAGTGDWHVGDAMDSRAAHTLTEAGYDATLHRARQFDPSWFDRADVVLAMDASNLRNARAMAPSDDATARIILYRAFDPEANGELEVPDPWYGGSKEYAEVLAIVERTTDALVTHLKELVA